MPHLQMEISALSPLRRIESVEEIRVGHHGLYVSQGGRHGLLLPQVATEYHMDRVAFLEALCQKALLPAGAWRDPASELRGFTVQRVAARIGA